MSQRVHRVITTFDGDAGQARQRRGELAEGRRHVERAAEWVREDQPVQQAPAVVVLVGGLVECGAERRAAMLVTSLTGLSRRAGQQAHRVGEPPPWGQRHCDLAAPRPTPTRQRIDNRSMFEIAVGPSEVNAWSDVRLPFEPKEAMVEFRDRLATAIRALPPVEGAHMAATYTAHGRAGLVDTENVLFYNVGLACFAAHTRKGLAFERVFADPPDLPSPSTWTPRHHHRYRQVSGITEFEHWRPLRLAAEWRDVPLASRALSRPETTWAELTTVDVPPGADGPLKYYALRIRLEGVHVSGATVVKPLIDGLVSSLHAFDGEIPDLVVTRLSHATGMSGHDIRLHLADEQRAVLGRRAHLIRPTKNGIAWNPRDEDCVACVLEIVESERPSLRGTVYSVAPVDSA